MKELGYQRGVPVRARRPRGIHPAGVPAGRAAGARRSTSPAPFGFEKEIAKRLAWWAELAARVRRRRDDLRRDGPVADASQDDTVDHRRRRDPDARGDACAQRWSGPRRPRARLGAGCASLGRSVFQEPVVKLPQRAASTGLGLTGGSARRRAQRLQPERLQARRDAADVPAARSTRSHVGSGALDERFVVQENDSLDGAAADVVHVRGHRRRRPRSCSQSGSVNYRVRGDVTVGTPSATSRVRTTAPAASRRSAARASYGTTGVSIAASADAPPRTIHVVTTRRIHHQLAT